MKLKVNLVSMYENCKVRNPRGKRTAVKMGEVVDR